MACGGEDEPEVQTSGDPTQAARTFMTAFLNGDLQGCGTYSTGAVRSSVLAQCQERADAQATTDLSTVSFVLLEQDGIEAVVEMRGTYTITAIDEGEAIARQENTPIRLLMRYEDDFWRFDDFVE